jgi:hypothetical protein
MHPGIDELMSLQMIDTASQKHVRRDEASSIQSHTNIKIRTQKTNKALPCAKDASLD